MKKVNLLSRAEIRKVLGGVAPTDCRIETYNKAAGALIDAWVAVCGNNTESCETISHNASVYASESVTSTVGSRYDCGCDGWGPPQA